MKTIFIHLIFTALVSGIASAAEGNPSKQDIGAMLGKEGSYEYNLVGKRLLRSIDEALLKRLLEDPEENEKQDYILST